MSSSSLPSTCSQCNTIASSVWKKMQNGDMQCIKCSAGPINRTLMVDLSRANLSLSADAHSTSQSLAIIAESNCKNIDKESISKRSRIIDESSNAVETCSDLTMSDVTISVSNMEQNAAALNEEKDAASDHKWIVRSQSHLSTRKSTRIKPTKTTKPQNNMKALATKGRGRRVIFKRNPIKSSPSVSTVVTRDHIFYDGSYWQVGDIVSVLDLEGGIYYAQLRGFLQDQYLEKSAVITWLIPMIASDPLRFQPSNYTLGPDEEVPRKMECFEFVCHAPSDYYRCLNAPFPVVSNQPEMGFIWTRLGPAIEPLTSMPDIISEEENPASRIVDIPKTVVDKKEMGKKVKEVVVKKQLIAKEKIKEKTGRL